MGVEEHGNVLAPEGGEGITLPPSGYIGLAPSSGGNFTTLLRMYNLITLLRRYSGATLRSYSFPTARGYSFTTSGGIHPEEGGRR